ncbi:MAG TPA: DUF934 domain-containing protein [Geobacterales bacterium]|nr:DUF934 domain-containing protein [Geobacterales bacterium]
MRYIKNSAVAADPFVYIEGDEPVPSDVPAIVSADWLLSAAKQQIQDRSAPLGVNWPNDKPESELAPFLTDLSLIALEFPVFRDGRAFTQARLLRERHGFKGEIRATGDVLRDQFLFMVRAGFDAFEVKKPADADAFAKAVHEFTLRYQPAADGPLHAFRSRLDLPEKGKQGDA